MAASLETDNRDLIGRKVECRAEHGAFAPCQWCGCVDGVLHHGGVHALGIACADCGRLGRWISKAEAARIDDHLVPEADVEVTFSLPAHMHRVFQHIVKSEDRPFNEVLIDYLRSGL